MMQFIVNNYCTIIINDAVNRFLTISQFCIFPHFANFIVLCFLLCLHPIFLVILLSYLYAGLILTQFDSQFYIKIKKHIVKYEMILVIVTLRSTSNQNHCNLSFYFDLYCEMGHYIFGNFKVVVMCC